MNSPCPECNFINWRISCAFTQRDWADVRFWQNKREEHNANCIVIHGDWYKLLWSNAVVVEGEQG